MKKILSFFLCILLLFLAAKCSSVRVAVNYDNSIDFSKYHTYTIIPVKKQNKRGSIDNIITKKNIANQINNLMKEKKFTEVKGKNNVDIRLIFYTHIINKKNWVAPTYRTGRWGRTRKTRPGHVVTYKQGTLIIDIVDCQKNELVWQGIGKDALNRSNPEQNFIKSVREILKEFPPQK